MAWRKEKTSEGEDLVWDGVETGIAPSPTKGTANLQNVNISTQTGEVLASYGRTAQQQVAISNGTLTASVSDGSILLDAPSTLKAGQWVSVSASSISSISTTTSPTTVAIDYLVVGGGGAGGGAANDGAGGGGGAGEVGTGSTSVSVGSYLVTVGAGGVGVSSTTQNSGSSSILAGIKTSVGGGAGGVGSVTNTSGVNGASGGGAGGSQGTLGTAGTASAGFAGGTSAGGANNNASGGGGGAGAVGANGSVGATAVAGAGGVGVTSSITGTSTYYGGGGGAGGQTNGGPVGGSTGGAGGLGGGGNGGLTGTSGGNPGTAATANTGGGGGGASSADAGVRVGGSGGSGIVIVSYVTGSCVATGGTISYTATNTVHTFTSSGVFRVLFIPKTNLYYVSYKNTSNKVKLSSVYDPYGTAPITHGTSGTATFSIVATVGSPIAKATEKYETSDATEYRYYILDSNSYVWVFDTQVYASSLAGSGVGITWMLAEPTAYPFDFTGMNVLNGWLFCLSVEQIYAKPTVNLGTFFIPIDGGYLLNPLQNHTNYAYVGHQGKLFYCDGNYIGEIFPTTSLITGIANIQSLSAYTASSTTGTIADIISGSIPYDPTGLSPRIPAVFFTDKLGTQPTNLTVGTVYYIEYTPALGTFEVYSASTSGSPINIATGATGTQYFNTFYPLGTGAGASSSTPTLQLTPQRLNLPTFENATCMVELGNQVLIGGITNTVYPWNQVDATPSSPIALPEANVKNIINVNTTGYIFAGNRGNIYVTNGSVASLAFKVPDYCAGVPGSQLTYIEPVFYWGDADYMRGRVYFSLLDQTATKAGNCGGVWSFIPSENIDPAQAVGLALRLENQNSYGDYDGVATVILPAQEQDAVSPQYWVGWQDSYSVGTSAFGIDFTATTPVTTYVIETDLLPTGTLLSKNTFTQAEYKLTTPFESGDSIQLYWRLNSTDAWTSAGTVITESADPISGYFKVNFQKTQWVQIRAIGTTGGTTSSSFVRLKDIRLR